MLAIAAPLVVVGAGISILFTAGQVAKGLINFLLVVADAVMFVLAQVEAQYRTSKRIDPRPRWQYMLFCLGYLVAAAMSAAVADWADANHLGWLGAVMTGPAYLSCFGAFVAFGRGALRGRVRRAFWRNPPMWLDQELQRSAT
jgi:hypothetical protein